MSEHQYVAFRAIDKPVSKKDLAYMRTQSSHAEITPWAFDSTYDYGDFHGNALEMLRRGYVLHLHYANFGIRKLLIRLPNGLPDASAAEPYFAEDGLQFLKDTRGPGGVLSIKPFHESGDLDQIGEFGDILDGLSSLRSEILDGDLRPLYLAQLVMACDGNHDPEETTEGPVPAGLDKPTTAQRALMELYELSDAFIAAAAQGSPPLAARDAIQTRHPEWLKKLSQAKKDAWLADLMGDAESTVRREIVTEFQKSHQASSLPTVHRGRTIAELETAADEIQMQKDRKSTVKAARQKEKRLADMAVNPDRTLRETEQLMKLRGRDAYIEISNLLTDLREALAGTSRADLAERQAQKLRKENPKLTLLISELRQRGFLEK